MGVMDYTPSYTPNYIKLAIDEVDCMRRKKGLNPLDLSLLGLNDTSLELILAREGIIFLIQMTDNN